MGLRINHKKIIVFTGATSGIGKSAALEFAKIGSKILLIYRNTEKANLLKEALKKQNAETEVEMMPPCDFFDLQGVAETARFIAEKYPIIDLLINNAGLVCMEKGYSSDGIENTFSVNHLAHFILTLHLLPNLKRAKNPRVIHTSSEAHYHPGEDFLDDINFEKKLYFVMRAYGNSKLANVMFSIKLAQLYGKDGIISHSFHPGRIKTNIWPTSKWYEKAFTFFVNFILKTPEEGAKPLLSLSLDEEYNRKESVFLWEMKEKTVHKPALDQEKLDRLWNMSLKMTEKYLPAKY